MTHKPYFLGVNPLEDFPLTVAFQFVCLLSNLDELIMNTVTHEPHLCGSPLGQLYDQNLSMIATRILLLLLHHYNIRSSNCPPILTGRISISYGPVIEDVSHLLAQGRQASRVKTLFKVPPSTSFGFLHPKGPGRATPLFGVLCLVPPTLEKPAKCCLYSET